MQPYRENPFIQRSRRALCGIQDPLLPLILEVGPHFMVIGFGLFQQNPPLNLQQGNF